MSRRAGVSRRQAVPRLALVSALCLASMLASVWGYFSESPGRGLSIDWLSECGCTGIEIESVGLATSLWQRGFHGLRLNRCQASNPRCEGQPKAIRPALKGLVSHRIGESAVPDVVIVHLAYLGICGLPDEVERYRRCGKGASHVSGGAWFLAWGTRRHLAGSGCKQPYLIARAMGEQDRIDAEAARRCNTLYDEVWVPSNFHHQAFTSSGVKPDRIHIIPELVDLAVFNPEETAEDFRLFDSGSTVETAFLSVFKWEPRKNWGQLLSAFVVVFLLEPSSGLYIKTSPYMGADPEIEGTRFVNSVLRGIAERPRQFLDVYTSLTGKKDKQAIEAMKQGWVFNSHDKRCITQRIVINSQRLPSSTMPSLFKAADVFVLPSHGEGWGLPLMEAMAMGLPTIGTRFGGNVDFMEPCCALLVDVAKLTDGPGFGNSGHWAEPDESQLMAHLHWVFGNPDAAKELGHRARRHISSKFHPDKVASTMTDRLEAIAAQLNQ